MKNVIRITVLAVAFLTLVCCIAQDNATEEDKMKTAALNDLKIIHMQIVTFYMLNFCIPTDQEGLQVLVVEPKRELRKWKQLLMQTPIDPWGRPYEYKTDPTHATGFRIFSKGPNANSDKDDIVYFDQTAFKLQK